MSTRLTRNKIIRTLHPLFAVVVAWALAAPPAAALNLTRLTPDEINTLQELLQTLEPVIAASKQDGSANLLTWDALYQPLTPPQRAFVDELRIVKASTLGATSHYFGEVSPAQLVRVAPQSVVKEGQRVLLDPQHLPRAAHDAYQQMMAAMEADLGKRLLIESGYRSPAYQLYLFLFYMPKHDYSVKETNRFVALPGHSEHGYPPRQAVDFINQDGVNGEDHPEEFEVLPEYQWLQQHAGAFGFVLSYPRDNPYHTAFEPWHWHYEPSPQSSAHN